MPPPRRKGPTATTTFRYSVALEQTAGADEKPTVWIQIARTGLWKGYRTGPIEFTAAMFDTLIRNFRSHPSFNAGADGKGDADVIPFDFNHEMEMDPHAVAAESWVQDLEARAGEGATELWAKTRLLEPAKSLIRAEKLKWTSVAVWLNATDPVSGEEIGPLLTSVAFTNQPFIEGMAPIAARRIAAGYLGYFDKARDAEDAICQLRNLLGLAQTSDVATVMGEVAKLRVWAENASAPLGVDIEGLVGAMRQILGLPALSTPAEVFTALDGLVRALIEQAALESPNLPSSDTSATLNPSSPLTAQRKEAAMELLVVLSQKLGLRSKTEDAVVEGVEIAAASHQSLKALFGTLKVKDQDEATARIVELSGQARLGALFGALTFDQAKALIDEHATLKKTVGKMEDEAATADVDAVMAAKGLGDEFRDVLLDARKRDPKAFAEKFGQPKPGEANLTRALFATETGAPRGSEATGASRRQAAGAPDVSAFSGRNKTEQAMSMIRATVQGADKWTHDAVFIAACEFNRTGQLPATVRGN